MDIREFAGCSLPTPNSGRREQGKSHRNARQHKRALGVGWRHIGKSMPERVLGIRLSPTLKRGNHIDHQAASENATFLDGRERKGRAMPKTGVTSERLPDSKAGLVKSCGS